MTSDDNQRLPAQSFSEAETARILDRLIELDRLDEKGLSRAQIEDIAQELGIPRRLVDRAIAERSARPPRSSLREALVLTAVGAGAFLPTAFFGTSQLWGILGVGTLSIAMGLDSRPADAGRRFRARNLGLWTGFVAGGSTLFSMAPDASLALVVGLPLLAGSGILALGRWMGSRGSGSGGTNHRGAAARFMAKLSRGARKGIGLWNQQFTSPHPPVTASRTLVTASSICSAVCAEVRKNRRRAARSGTAG